MHTQNQPNVLNNKVTQQKKRNILGPLELCLSVKRQKPRHRSFVNKKDVTFTGPVDLRHLLWFITLESCYVMFPKSSLSRH
jgi:hypothetical protein